MQFYVAPLEGITGYVFRNVHHKHFPGADQYYIPFIEPKPNARKVWTGREWNDIQPAHNEGIRVIPQILTSKWEDFLWTAEKLGDIGYQEVNLNLGCPSKTVINKGRGSGFLAFPEKLDEFLYYIFDQCKLKISIKTRLGKEDPEEFEKILEIYKKYPIKELIIHPRTQTDFYTKPMHPEYFAHVYEQKNFVLGYNGEIVTKQDYQKLEENYPEINSCMLGRGILRNPQLIENIKNHTEPDRKRIKKYHDELLTAYREELSGDMNVLYRMKELWCYMSKLFDEDNPYTKKILKVKKLEDFIVVQERIFEECDFSKKENACSSGIWKL